MKRKNNVAKVAKTGHRPVLSNAEPRNSTVCFNLSASEKLDLDKLGMSMNHTRSAILSKMTATFVRGAMNEGDFSELKEWFDEARKCHVEYGDQTEKILNRNE